MARRNRRYGREIFNQFFLRGNYMSSEAFENAIKERLKNPYWSYGKRKNITVRIIRNKHGARVVAYESNT